MLTKRKEWETSGPITVVSWYTCTPCWQSKVVCQFEGPSTAHGGDLSSQKLSSFLPTEADVDAIKHNLTVLVGRTLTTYIKRLQPLSKVLPAHIHHNFSVQMAQTSEVFFWGCTNEKWSQTFWYAGYHESWAGISWKELTYREKVMSGGDQLTCERQVGSKQHVMDGNTPKEHLQVLEPVCEDWDALMCFLTVNWCHPFYSME